jgi:DNA-binding NtrC family response regulator
VHSIFPICSEAEPKFMTQFPVRITDPMLAEGAQPHPDVAEKASGSPSPQEIGVDAEPILPLRSLRAQVESQAIKTALQRTGWNRKQAARLLKISYRGLLYKIHRHNISPTIEQA